VKGVITLKPIAKVFSGFPEKFGVPRQSGIVEGIKSKIVFEPEFRDPSALRGLDGFSHLWLIWYFSENDRGDEKFSPTVRPPRLGGNRRVGVFATRSPFRPNPLGLSLVKIDKIEFSEKDGPIIHIFGADLLNGTPVFDIKPYLPYFESRSDAKAGFSSDFEDYSLDVIFSEEAKGVIEEENRLLFSEILAQDPRPAYQTDTERLYRFEMYGYRLSFIVNGRELIVKKAEKI